jgi:Amt family ammonium transporter
VAAPIPDKGDTTWMLVSTVLVLLMIVPGLALFYGGLVRQKNMLSMLMQVGVVTVIGMIAWLFWGYSLSFSDGGSLDKFIGGGGRLFLQDVTPASTVATFSTGVVIPELVFMAFQMTFACITAALVLGGVAERMKFAAVVIFAILWPLLSYYPLAHMVWWWAGPDAVAAAPNDPIQAGLLWGFGALDFAGGTVVHINAGIAALMGALILGPRIGKYVGGKPQAIPGHNLALATLGCLILWIGWYGFNPGSVLVMNETVPYVAVTTTLGAAGGAISGTLASQLPGIGPDKRPGKPDLTMTINGILAGLVGITAGCDGYTMGGAWVVGFIAGGLVVLSVHLIDSLGIDDPVGAWSVHGTCGIWGTLAVALFNQDKGLFYGHGFAQMGLQLLGIVVYAVFAIVTSWIAWTVIGAIFGGIRVSETEEIEGLDISEHGMEAYPDFSIAQQ